MAYNVALHRLQDEARIQRTVGYKARWLLRRIYTRLFLATHADDVRWRLLNDPCLYNARHYAKLGHVEQFEVMAIHYNTEVDPRAAITAAEVRQLIELEI